MEIVGTDLHPGVIEQARRGAYPASRTREVSPERLARFFLRDGDGYVVGDELRALVRFEVQDVTRETPPGPFDLVVCRNVLIYFEEALQARVLERFRAALRPDGTLFLGRSEVILPRHEAFRAHGPRRLFQAAIFHGSRAPAGGPEAPPPGTAPNVSAILLADSDAVLLVVDASWRVASANARAERILGDGTVGSGLLDALPEWDGSPVHEALRASLAEGRSVRVLGAPSPVGPLDLTVEPFPPGSGMLLLVGHAARPVASETHTAGDLAATHDELQAANEELATANEELQASNEEFASLNEEFQSTNENLASTNAELRAGAVPASLLRAMLAGRQEATVLCDRDRRVVLFNAAAEARLGLGEDA
ncbi:MAG TPA: CheR family methyltransferase, partial [Candidatus Thermoplasmatota archaeon]|nr:CheR family methyltransferase [Candidatus Thermoplasmatota archaeon]